MALPISLKKSARSSRTQRTFHASLTALQGNKNNNQLLRAPARSPRRHPTTRPRADTTDQTAPGQSIPGARGIGRSVQLLAVPREWRRLHHRHLRREPLMLVVDSVAAGSLEIPQSGAIAASGTPDPAGCRHWHRTRCASAFSCSELVGFENWRKRAARLERKRGAEARSACPHPTRSPAVALGSQSQFAFCRSVGPAARVHLARTYCTQYIVQCSRGLVLDLAGVLLRARPHADASGSSSSSPRRRLRQLAAAVVRTRSRLTRRAAREREISARGSTRRGPIDCCSSERLVQL